VLVLELRQHQYGVGSYSVKPTISAYCNKLLFSFFLVFVPIHHNNIACVYT